MTENCVYTYFVHFTYSGGDGWTTTRLATALKTHQDLVVLGENIASKIQQETVVITNFILLDVEFEDES